MANWEGEKRKRHQKTSFEQKQIYCSFLEGNPKMCQTKNNDTIVQPEWEQLVKLLNATSGPKHDMAEWKTVFDNWRYSVTHKLREEKKSIKKTGGGSPEIKNTLNELEERAMCCWGRIVVDGHKKVCTVGLKVEPCETEFTDGKENFVPPKPINASPKQKRLKKNVGNNSDDDVFVFLERNQSSRLKIGDEINVRLENIATSINNLTAAQLDTADALKTLIHVFNK